MGDLGSIRHLIALAVQAEAINERFYRRLSRMFPYNPEVQDFWKAYAEEEIGHTLWLQKLTERFPSDRLDEPADPMMMENAGRATRVSVDSLLFSIRTLQDAFELANELEHSETNAVFEFLISYFAEDDETHAFLRAQLNSHIARLMIDFPKTVGTGMLRRGIMAKKD